MTGGPQNYSFWSNPKFDALVDQIDAEFDQTKRQALIRQIEEILEQDPPVLPICWEQINDVWWNYVKGYNPYDYFGVYDTGHVTRHWQYPERSPLVAVGQSTAAVLVSANCASAQRQTIAVLPLLPRFAISTP